MEFIYTPRKENRIPYKSFYKNNDFKNTKKNMKLTYKVESHC